MSIEVAAGERIFVAWDSSSTSMKINLEGLKEGEAFKHYDIDVPVLEPAAGSILNDIVIPGIKKADRVLVLTDRPNANVGFEAGLAWGLGKPILLAYRGRKLPLWTKIPPFKNYIKSSWYGVSDLEQMIKEKKYWFKADYPAPPLPTGKGFCLDLCPKEGTGESLRRVRSRLSLNDWKYPEELSRRFHLNELNHVFKDADRLVWTIVDSEVLPEYGESDRDGAINAAHGVIAGWFYSRCLEGNDAPFWVLRLQDDKEVREVVDIELEEYPFSGTEEYKSLIEEQIEEYWQSSRSEEIYDTESTANETVSLAVLPFENLSDHEFGDGFSLGLTIELINALNNSDQLDIVPSTSVITVGRADLSNEEAASKLDVKYIVRGSLTQKGNYCLIEVRLYLAGVSKPRRSYRRRHLWDDVLNNSVVGHIIDEISNGLNKNLSFDTQLPNYNTKAKELYWRGLHESEIYNNIRKPDAALKARQLFQEAVIKDGSYENARIQLGFLDILRWETIGNPQFLKDSLDIWKDIIARNPNAPVALAETGYINFVMGENIGSALDYLYQALEGNPDHVLANNVLALLYLYLGYYESNIKLENEKVITADPAYVYPLANAALAHQLLSQYDMALAMARKALDIDQQAFVGFILKGAQFFYQGRFEEANTIWRKGFDDSEEEIKPVFEVLLSWILAVNGDESAAAITLSTHRGSEWIHGAYGPYYISLCAVCGESDEAIELLEQAPTFASSYRYLVSEPTLHSLTARRAYQDLLEKRYREWEATLNVFEDKLPIVPPKVPTPADVLRQSSVPKTI